MEIAIEFIRISLNQLCVIGLGTTLNDVYIPTAEDELLGMPDNREHIKILLMIEGSILSLSKLISEKSGQTLMKRKNKDTTKKKLTIGCHLKMQFQRMETLNFGELVELKNCDKTLDNGKLATFFRKRSPESMEEEEDNTFKTRLTKLGISAREYREKFEDNDHE
uniref:Uncharacterized protein n=3 Tax=Clytia hemisphaerica TaxID=252671 RepID=A0A7M5UIB2_9CNID